MVFLPMEQEESIGIIHGEYLAVADNEGQVLIYNIKGELIRKFMNENNSTKGITAIDWHPHKNILTTVS